MPNSILVSTKDGDKVVMVHSIKSIEAVPGKPAVPGSPATEAVEADPGRPASGSDPGSPPVKAEPAKEEVKPVAAVPETAIIHTEDGDYEVGLTVAQLQGLIG